MPLITLRDIQLSYGEQPILDHVTLSIEPGERLCLIGRNGTGKSTLMKVISSEIQADDGQIETIQGLTVARLEQEVPDDEAHTVSAMVAQGLGDLGALLTEHDEIAARLGDADNAMFQRFEQLSSEMEARGAWQLSQRVDTVLSKLELDGSMSFSGLSGGMKRRVLLARALVQEPDILLLDEPTNHLDVASIQWLEEFLKGFGSTLVFISHDRAFIRALATRIIELDRGLLTSWPGNYDAYLQWKQAALESEDKSNAEFEKRLSQEEKWIRQGIKARRTRNEGRVRALKAMREEMAQRRQRMGTANLTIQSNDNSGKIVVEAQQTSYTIDGLQIVKDFSLTLLRGDRVGILGPNGCGKSTLIRLLLGRLTPDSGNVKTGTQLQVAYFDQLRDTLDGEKSVIDNVAEGSDVVTVNGQSKHVIGYLQDFLFDPKRVRQPVKALSGGERNRLLLAKLFTKPFNLLVLDEPTNDLDAETLELLEEQLTHYQGTLLLVSHDREFINNVVTSTVVFEHGTVNTYVGGYQDWLRQRPKVATDKQAKKEKASLSRVANAEPSPPKAVSNKLTYKEKLELEALPDKLEALEQEIAALEATLADPGFYQNDAKTVSATQARFEALQTELDTTFNRWEALDSRAD